VDSKILRTFTQIEYAGEIPGKFPGIRREHFNACLEAASRLRDVEGLEIVSAA